MSLSLTKECSRCHQSFEGLHELYCSSCQSKPMSLEAAKQQYQEAWEEYRFNFDLVRKKELEILMDQAQDSFTWHEFQEFKVTLPGYVEYWSFLYDKGMKAIEQLKKGQVSQW